MKKIIELVTRVFSDKCPGDGFKSIVVFALTKDIFSDVIKRASEIYFKKNVPVIINGAGTISGYVGVDKYREALLKAGIKPGDIYVAEPIDDKMLHTRNESIAYIRFLKENNFSNALLISAPFHQTRAFMTMVTITLEENVNIKLYNCPVVNFDWNKKITHSQGVLTKIAHELIHEEIERIEKYQKKGDLESVENVMKYLYSREIR